jgi:hypothetical protein
VKSTFVYLRRLGALSLTTIETVLIYVGIPALVIVVITGLVFAGDMRRAKRYRPGRPFEFRPVWFLSAPDQYDGGHPADHGGTRELAGRETRAALTSAPGGGGTGNATLTGGASDRW